MRTPTEQPAFCRVTLLTPRSRVDVALPADVPLAELVPLVLELLGEPRPPHSPSPWRFSGATGGPLPPAATLDGLGVLDGELLRIGPHAPAPAAPVFDDPVDALAATAGQGGGTGGAALRAGIAVGGAVLAGGLVALVQGLSGGPAPQVVLMVLAVLLATTATAVCLARAAGAAGDGAAGNGAARLGAVTAATCAVPFAAAAGWVAVPGPPGSGQLLVAGAAAGTAAAVGQVVVRVIAPVLVATVVVGTVLVVLALLRLWLHLPPEALAAGAGASALAVGPLLPRLALRLAGLPQPSVPADADELVGTGGLDQLPPDELSDQADLARGFLAGLVAGAATVVGAAAVPVAAAGGWSGPALATVILIVTGLRSRGFADRTPARASLIAALAGAAAVAVVVAAHGGPVTRLVIAAGTGAVGLAAAAMIGRAEPVASPVSRRTVDLLEGALMAAAIPLALGAMGAYALVRGL